MRIELTLDLDEDLAKRFRSALESGEYGSTQDAVMLAALTMLLDCEAQLDEENRLLAMLDESEASGTLTEEDWQASRRDYWARRDAAEAATAAED